LHASPAINLLLLSSDSDSQEIIISNIVINRENLSQSAVDDLLTALTVPLDTPVESGDYWYDPVSGLWGFEGGPSQGQIPPDLDIGGPLQADASGDSNTGVFLNSREIAVEELLVLLNYFGVSIFADPAVYQGRYWLKADGSYGLGDVPDVNRTGSFVDNGGQVGGYVTDPGSGIVNWAGGSVLGGGDTVGFISSEPGGISVTCGPDGGCIY
jgi:hypothetical protein